MNDTTIVEHLRSILAEVRMQTALLTQILAQQLPVHPTAEEMTRGVEDWDGQWDGE